MAGHCSQNSELELRNTLLLFHRTPTHKKIEMKITAADKRYGRQPILYTLSSVSCTKLHPKRKWNEEHCTSKAPLLQGPPSPDFQPFIRLIYSAAICALLYHHITTLLSPSSTPTWLSISMLTADIFLAFMWLNSQAFRMNPLVSEPLPHNLQHLPAEDFPALDVFVCTADPSKEPPIGVAATVLSAMAYNYPAEKLSVYVSDDGASQLTLFALMEAAEFGKEWLPFCKENRVMERCPDAYFRSDFDIFDSQTHKIKVVSRLDLQ